MDLDEKNDIVSIVKSDLKKWCKKWIIFLFGGFSVLGLWGIYSVYTQAIHKTGEIITLQITEKFSDSNVSETFNKVAKNQAKQIINNKLNPAIKSAKESINSQLLIFDTKIKESNHQYDLEFESLQKKLTYINNITNIIKLGDQAIATGLAKPFDKLVLIIKTAKNNDIKITAQAQINRILVYVSQFPFIMDEISFTLNGSNKKLNLINMKTSDLIAILQDKNIPSSIRGVCANILSNRREKGVLDILLKVARNDTFLLVRRNCINSFEKLTGFTNHVSEINNIGFVKNDFVNIDLTKKVFLKNKEKWENKFLNMK